MAVVLGLSASLLWGVSDFLGGFGSRRFHLLAVLAVSFPAGTIVVAGVVAARGNGPPSALPLVYAALGGLGGVVGIAALYRGLAIGSMGVVAPITAASPLIPLTVGLLRGERPGGLQLAGISIALLGIVLASREPGGADESGRLATGVGLAFLAAACFGGTLIAIDSASAADPYWATVVLRLTGCLVVAVALVATRPPMASFGESLTALAPIGVLDATATMLFAVATTKGLVSVVSVLASLYPLVVVLLARGFLGERLARTQRLGALAALGGVAMISAG